MANPQHERDSPPGSEPEDNPDSADEQAGVAGHAGDRSANAIFDEIARIKADLKQIAAHADEHSAAETKELIERGLRDLEDIRAALQSLHSPDR